MADCGEKFGLGQVGRLGFGLCSLQMRIGLPQLVQGTVQCIGPLPDLLGQQHGTLEGGIGRTIGATI